MIPLGRSAKTMIYAMTALAAACISASCLHLSMRQDERHNRILAADLDSFRTEAHLLRGCYEHCAERADAEGLARQACLFRALAHSERVHEETCTRAAQLFDLRTAEHDAVSPAVGTNATADAFLPADADRLHTDENLRRSIVHEHQRLGKPRGAAVERAIAAGNYYVARIFIWIEGTDRRHIELLEGSLRETPDRNAAPDLNAAPAAILTSATSAPAAVNTDDEPVLPCEYCVCPVCGNVYQASNCDAYCPLCRTHCSSFEPF